MADEARLLVKDRPIRALRFIGGAVGLLGGILILVALASGAYRGLLGALLLVYALLNVGAFAWLLFTVADMQEELSALRRRLHLGA